MGNLCCESWANWAPLRRAPIVPDALRDDFEARARVDLGNPVGAEELLADCICIVYPGVSYRGRRCKLDPSAWSVSSTL